MIESHVVVASGDLRRRRSPLRRRAVSVAVCAATVLAAGGSAVPAVGLAAPVPGCAKWTAVFVEGTGETSAAADPGQPVSGMLAPVAHALQTRYGSDLAIESLPYSASLSPTYASSESSGAQALSSVLSGLCASTQVILVGYSQGADIAGDLAARIGNNQGPLPASRILAVGLVADPRRDSSTPQLGSPAGGEGVEGPRTAGFGVLAGRVRTVCATGDLYCSVSPQTDPVVTTIGRAFTGNPTPTTPGSPQSTATNSGLGDLDASTVTRQVLIVLAGMASTAANLPTIGADLLALPQKLAAVDIEGTHQIAADLNNQFHPLITMASQVDLHLIAQILTLFAPADTSGVTGAAAQIVEVLARLDINRLATDAGTAQEVAWQAVQKLTTGDPLGAGLELVGLVPVAADLAAVAAAALTGTTAAPLASLGTAAASGGSTPASALTDLARQGTDAAQFFASGVHQSGYSTGLQQLTTWLTDLLDRAR
ncbi:cutinase family protein [Nocardia terpenica]|uniref:cutinase family protein n=1 Tax=Nocardia terpenica TaxID=455432 RepID=UPI0015C56D44|nr:cutinase family protein [Nocardia terpenica]NQE91710.1 cutinase family protein [Nocardia terpenica]